MKPLICYFSASGITKKVAEEIAQIVEGDLFEIEPSEPYTNEDLDWTNKQSRSSIEMADEHSRPSVKSKVEDIEKYHTILLGFPVWWYKEPTIIDTFIEENNFENKVVYVFVTSGGSTVRSSLESLRKKYTTIQFVDGKTLNGSVTRDTIFNWIL